MLFNTVQAFPGSALWNFSWASLQDAVRLHPCIEVARQIFSRSPSIRESSSINSGDKSYNLSYCNFFRCSNPWESLFILGHVSITKSFRSGISPSSTINSSNSFKPQSLRVSSCWNPPEVQTIFFNIEEQRDNLRNLKFGSFSRVTIGSCSIFKHSNSKEMRFGG